jgi:hypothetical protein
MQNASPGVGRRLAERFLILARESAVVPYSPTGCDICERLTSAFVAQQFAANLIELNRTDVAERTDAYSRLKDILQRAAAGPDCGTQVPDAVVRGNFRPTGDILCFIMVAALSA